MISVVTITFNNYSELMDTVESLKDQSEIQHVVINGGKSEETLKFLKNYSGKSLSEKDFGISDAFNKGLRESDGDAVVYLNSGDKLIDPHYYREAASLLEKDPTIDFVHAEIHFLDTIAGKLLLKPGDKLPSMPFLHPTLIVRKSIFEKIGGFDLNWRSGMDLDFVYRLLKNGSRGHYISRPVVEMDGRGISSAKPFLGFWEKVAIVRKNRDFRPYTLITLLKTFLKLSLRVFLSKMGLENVISSYRKKKYLN